MINFWSIVIEPTVGESPSGPKKIVKAGGLVVEDIKVGSGAEAKNGKHVSIIEITNWHNYYNISFAQTNTRTFNNILTKLYDPVTLSLVLNIINYVLIAKQ